MSYTLSYRTSVGALTVAALDEAEALQKAHALASEGFAAVEIIDGEGHRHAPEAFERSVNRSGGRSTLH